MINETIYLKDFFEGIKTDATVTTYVRSNSDEIEPGRKRASVLICPGGGYFRTVDREAEPIALAFLAKGYNAFVLRYSTRDKTEETYPTQLLEASAAVAFMRRNIDKYNIKKESIAVCGFSAGGHLAACLGMLWDESFISEALGTEAGENRPDGMVLAYPVITSGEYANMGSFEFLLGKGKDYKIPEEKKYLLDELSLEKRVSEKTVPGFIWHTFDDEMVPSENSLLLATAMKKAGVPFELHFYPEGVHGLGLGSRETRDVEAHRENSYIESWFDLCAKWLAKYIDREEK